MAIDTTEEKDVAEPAALTFYFPDIPLPIVSAKILSAEPINGVDPGITSWLPGMVATPGTIDGTLETGAIVAANKYAQAVFPQGAGVRGLYYKFRCQVTTADPDISPVCALICPVV